MECEGALSALYDNNIAIKICHEDPITAHISSTTTTCCNPRYESCDLIHQSCDPKAQRPWGDSTIQAVRSWIEKPEQSELKKKQSEVYGTSPIVQASKRRGLSRRALAAKIDHLLPPLPSTASFEAPWSRKTDLIYDLSSSHLPIDGECNPGMQCKKKVSLEVRVYPLPPAMTTQPCGKPLVVFLLNWENARSGGRVILSISGHWNHHPLGEIGITTEVSPNNGPHEILAHLALAGYPIVAFSDETIFSVSVQNCKVDGTKRFLAIAEFLESNVLPHSKYQVDALGISGGAQRLLWLLRTKLNVRSAYIAETFNPTWWESYNASTNSDGWDPDILYRPFTDKLLWADLALLGLERHRTDIALVMNVGEDGRDKYGFAETTEYLLPYASYPYRRRLQTRGNDRHTCIDPPDCTLSGKCHEYNVDDYVSFLREVRSDKQPQVRFTPTTKDFSVCPPN